MNTGAAIQSYAIPQFNSVGANFINNGLVFLGLVDSEPAGPEGGIVLVYDYSDQTLVNTITVPNGIRNPAYSFCEEFIFIRTSLSTFPQTEYYYVYDTTNFSIINSFTETDSSVTVLGEDTIYIDRDILIRIYEDNDPNPNIIGAFVDSITQPIEWNESTKTATVTGTINQINTIMNSGDICVIPLLDLNQTIVLDYQASSNTISLESAVVDQNITNV
jgi:hypothetical protein